MYNNIGLQSVRGTGTSGYVQKNLANIPKNRQNLSWEASLEREEKLAQRKPVQYVADREILEHDRKKKIEIALLEWAEAAGILDSDMPQEEQDRLMNKKREELTEQFERRGAPKRPETFNSRSSHLERQEKDVQQARMAGALGIRDDYREGQGFDPEWQMKERDMNKQKREEIERLRREEQFLMRQLEEKRRDGSHPASERRYSDDRDEKSGSRGKRDVYSPPRRHRDTYSPSHRRRDDRESPRLARRDESPVRGRKSPSQPESSSPPRRRRESPSPPRRRRSPSPSDRQGARSPVRSRMDTDRPASPTLANSSPEYAPRPSPPRSSLAKIDAKPDSIEEASAMDVDVPKIENSQSSAPVASDAPSEVKTEDTKTVEEPENDKPVEEVASEADTNEESATPRKRGRSKKATAAKKASTSVASPEKEEEEAKPKAKRGRAKKATAATKASEEEPAAAEADDAPENEAPEPTPKKRGRAKKAAATKEDDDSEEPPAPKRAKRSAK